MKVFYHHIYEYKKGLRNLVLHTIDTIHKDEIILKLKSKNISYFIQDVNPSKINVFFGAKTCIEVIKHFGSKKLNQFTPEQDFILGIMLGYDRIQQCERYIDRSIEKFKPNYQTKPVFETLEQIICYE